MSKIEWTKNPDGTSGKTWNPVTGCSKVSAGCKHCYAETMHGRLAAMGQPKYRHPFNEVRCHREALELPLRWKKPCRVFVNSMSDLFHEDVPGHFIDEVFAVMAMSRHVFQILTKRPDRMMNHISAMRPELIRQLAYGLVHDLCDGPRSTLSERLTRLYAGKSRDLWACDALDAGREWPLPNVWLGVSVEDQQTADERIPLLLQTPAAVRFVSLEPMLGPVDFEHIGNALFDRRAAIRRAMHGAAALNWDQADASIGHVELNWVIAGGESGPKARPAHPDWFRSVRDQCVEAGVPFFFKQWGEWAPCGEYYGVGDEPNLLAGMERVGKKAAGRALDGRVWDQMPEARR